jgi:hypothetical protein
VLESLEDRIVAGIASILEIFFGNSCRALTGWLIRRQEHCLPDLLKKIGKLLAIAKPGRYPLPSSDERGTTRRAGLRSIP